MDNEGLKEQDQFEELIQGLMDHKYGCCDDFMIPGAVTGLRDNIQTLSASANMKDSGLGNKIDFQRNNEIRGDKIKWIEEESTNPFELIYLRKIGKFINHLNKTCFTSLKSFESHYSVYGKRSVYKRHLDQFKNEKGRKFSIILYLNQDWKEEDGGMLSLYLQEDEQKDIFPIGGRMIFVRSDEMEHEVHASSTRDRSSIAGWLKDQ